GPSGGPENRRPLFIIQDNSGPGSAQRSSSSSSKSSSSSRSSSSRSSSSSSSRSSSRSSSSSSSSSKVNPSSSNSSSSSSNFRRRSAGSTDVCQAHMMSSAFKECCRGRPYDASATRDARAAFLRSFTGSTRLRRRMVFGVTS